MSIQPISRWQSVIAFVSIAKISSFIKVSMILGSYTARFSALNAVMPVTGAWCGLGGSTLIVAVGLMFRFLFHGFDLPLHMFAYYIPGLFGAYYFATQSSSVRLLVPLFCMAFFVLHPVGLVSWVYAMYWWIPVALYAINKKSLWLEALGSTFVVHAVGSVIWIYTVETTATMWFSLLPIVAIERLLFTLGIVVLHKSISWISDNLLMPRLRAA